LPAGEVIRVDAQLKLSTTQESVQVVAETPLLETAASNFSARVESQTIDQIPLQGRDLQQLVFLVPGVNNVGGPPRTPPIGSTLQHLNRPSGVIPSSGRIIIPTTRARICLALRASAWEMPAHPASTIWTLPSANSFTSPSSAISNSDGKCSIH
jgi:hypothetical protein